MPKPESRIGALWLNDGSNEKAPFAKGSVEIDGKVVRIVIWRNRYKQPGERSPDLHIDIDKPREDRPQEPRREPPKQEAPAVAAVRDVFKAGGDEFTDDIPF